jgi:YesN/AraC family two-component response regulator
MKKKTILLVEDEAVVRDMIRGALEREYHVVEASTCSEALKRLADPIDIVLLDYALPDRDGFEVLKEIRSAKPFLPVILMTGYGSEHVVIKALRTGVTDYIKKPISFSYLMKRLSEILGTKPGETDWSDSVTREEFIMDGIAVYIEDRSTEDLSLEKLARMACLSKFNFCRAFKSRFGQSLTSYLNSVRVRRAARLLSDANLTITEIATFVGYDSLAHFGRVFRKVYGVSPSEFRRKTENEKGR